MLWSRFFLHTALANITDFVTNLSVVSYTRVMESFFLHTALANITDFVTNFDWSIHNCKHLRLYVRSIQNDVCVCVDVS